MTHWSPVAMVVSAGRWSSTGDRGVMGVEEFAALDGAGRRGRSTSTGMVGHEAVPARRRADPGAQGPSGPEHHPRGTPVMRILITNDDGVFAPGIAALARGLWKALGDEHDLVVVAPLVDHSGASAAVGRVYERESIPYEAVDIP